MGLMHDRGLALIDYCLCAVVFYGVLDLGQRGGSQAPSPRQRKWLLAGLVCATSGLWAAALVGLEVFAAWPVQGYGLPGAAWAWIGALAVAAPALYTGAAGRNSRLRLAAAPALMFVGLSGLHLGAIAALRLHPPEDYARLPLGGALLLAAGTVLLLLTICASLQRYAGSNRSAVQLAAALVLAAAVCADQLAFVHAVRLAPLAAASGRLMPAQWAGTILAPVAAGAMLIVILLSRMEAQAVAERHARERQRLAEESIRRVTYFDSVTGLPNRSQFSEALVRQLISVNGRAPPPFGVLHAEIRNYAQLLESLGQDRLNRVLSRLAQQLAATVQQGDLLARLSHDSFAFLLRRCAAADVQAALDRVAASLIAPLHDDSQWVELAWAVGSSHYPSGGNSTRVLLRAAMKPQREFRNDAGPHPGDSASSLLLA